MQDQPPGLASDNQPRVHLWANHTHTDPVLLSHSALPAGQAAPPLPGGLPPCHPSVSGLAVRGGQFVSPCRCCQAAGAHRWYHPPSARGSHSCCWRESFRRESVSCCCCCGRRRRWSWIPFRQSEAFCHCRPTRCRHWSSGDCRSERWTTHASLLCKHGNDGLCWRGVGRARARWRRPGAVGPGARAV